MPNPILTANEFRKLPPRERALYIYTEITATNKEVCNTNTNLKKLNGTVSRHEKIIWILTGVVLALGVVYGQPGIVKLLAFL